MHFCVMLHIFSWKIIFSVVLKYVHKAWEKNTGGNYFLLHPILTCVIKLGFLKSIQDITSCFVFYVWAGETGQIPLYMQTWLSFCFFISMDSILFALVPPSLHTVLWLCLKAGAHLKYWYHSLCSHTEQQIRKSDSQATEQGSRHQQKCRSGEDCAEEIGLLLSSDVGLSSQLWGELLSDKQIWWICVIYI